MNYFLKTIIQKIDVMKITIVKSIASGVMLTMYTKSDKIAIC